jgi:hypothetical protein
MSFLSKTLLYPDSDIRHNTFTTPECCTTQKRCYGYYSQGLYLCILSCHDVNFYLVYWWKFLFVVHCSRFPVLKSLWIILGACVIFLRKHALICRGYWTEPDIFQRYFVWKYKFARISVELIWFSQNLFHWRKWVNSLNSLSKTRKTLKATHLFKKNYDLFFLYFEKIWNKT